MDQVELPEVAALVDEGETAKTSRSNRLRKKSCAAVGRGPEEEEGAKKTPVQIVNAMTPAQKPAWR